MSLALGTGWLYRIKKIKEKKAQPSDHKHVLPQPQTEAKAALCASLPPALFHSLCFNTSLFRLPSCPTHWILIPACHVFFFFFLHLPPPSPDPCCVSSNYRSTEKTLSFKGLAIISVEHNKMASPQEEGEVWAAVRRCMLHRLALEVGAEVEVLQEVYFPFSFFPHLLLLRYLIIKEKDGGALLQEICSFLLLSHHSLKYECSLNWKRLK